MLRHSEFHRSHRIGWLRAAVLGANDGIVSTASLIIGVAAAHASHDTFYSLASLVWLLAPCRWQRVNTFLSARNRILKMPI